MGSTSMRHSVIISSHTWRSSIKMQKEWNKQQITHPPTYKKLSLRRAGSRVTDWHYELWWNTLGSMLWDALYCLEDKITRTLEENRRSLHRKFPGWLQNTNSTWDTGWMDPAGLFPVLVIAAEVIPNCSNKYSVWSRREKHSPCQSTSTFFWAALSSCRKRSY